MDGKKLRIDYHVILEEYRTGHPDMDSSLCDILSRGVYNGALSKHGGILISGINPSNDEKPEKELPCNRLTECIGKYWKPYVEIANSFSEDMVGYLDVFPLRCTKEADLLKIVPIDLKVSLIRKFMQVVEEYIRPNLIIYTNKSTGYLWGTDESHPWMGYKLLPIRTDKRLSVKGNLYRIIGRQHSAACIYPEVTHNKCNLVGCYLFITNFYQYAKKEAKLTVGDVKTLWNEYALLNVDRERKVEPASVNFNSQKGVDIHIDNIGYFPIYHRFQYSSANSVQYVKDDITLLKKSECPNPELIAFLERYVKVYEDVYGVDANTNKNATTPFAEVYTDEVKLNTPKLEVVNRWFDGDDFGDARYHVLNDLAEVLPDEVTDDPLAYFDEKSLCQILVNNCSLCHSLAYYLPQYLEDDITECDREIERLHGFLSVIDDKEDVIRIIRHSTDAYNATLQLVKKKHLTKLQAEAITSFTFSQFAGLAESILRMNLYDERKLRDFLVQLRD